MDKICTFVEQTAAFGTLYVCVYVCVCVCVRAYVSTCTTCVFVQQHGKANREVNHQKRVHVQVGFSLSLPKEERSKDVQKEQRDEE